MSSNEEAQRLARAAKLNLMLQEPENRVKASSIVQALLVYNVCNTQKELERIDGEIQRIRDACAAQGDHRRDFAEKQEAVRKDVDGLRLLVSEAGGLAQTHGDDLRALTEKVNCLYSQQTAHNAKLSEDIQFMTRTIDSCQQDFDRARRTIEDHESARVAAQREEMEKLRAAIEDMRTETDRLREELSQEPTSRSSQNHHHQQQQQQQQQQALAEVMRQQEQSSQFLEQLASKQGALWGFLEKLPVGPPDLEQPAGESEADKPATITTTITTTTFAPSASTPTPKSSSKPTSKPAPASAANPGAAHAQPVSPEVVRFWKTFCRYRKSHRARAPRSERSFVGYFLKNLDPRAAAFVRARLRLEHPGVFVAAAALGPGPGSSRDGNSVGDHDDNDNDNDREGEGEDEEQVFAAAAAGLAWHHVETTVYNLDMRELQDAVIAGESSSSSSSPFSVAAPAAASETSTPLPPPPSSTDDGADPDTATRRQSKRRKAGA